MVSESGMASVGLRLPPHGRSVAATSEDTASLDLSTAERLGEAFAKGSGYGLLGLGAGEDGQVLPPVFT